MNFGGGGGDANVMLMLVLLLMKVMIMIVPLPIFIVFYTQSRISCYHSEAVNSEDDKKKEKEAIAQAKIPLHLFPSTYRTRNLKVIIRIDPIHPSNPLIFSQKRLILDNLHDSQLR